MLELKTQYFEDHALQVYENERIIFGFTEKGFSTEALQRFFKLRPLLLLKQIHSVQIVKIDEWQSGSEGDGLFLDKPGPVAVIQTADCVPLFFFNENFSVGGVIHVGWSGLLKGIENKLLQMLPDKPEKYFYYLGPAIEKDCYLVGEDLRILFKDKPYVESIFRHDQNEKYFMDIKAGLIMSLLDAGIAAKQIQDCELCTYCLERRFPSYRREGKTGKRIYNFLALR